MTSEVIDGRPVRPYKRVLGLLSRRSVSKGVCMRWIVPGVLVLVAVIHALPLAGVLGAGKLLQLYGVPVPDPNTELLLRHRAVLFGLLAALLGYAAFRPDLHRLALVAGLASVVSYLGLWAAMAGTNAALAVVARVDGVALVLLLVAGAVHLKGVR